MGKIYTVGNQKGGVGKTTTTHNLAAGLHELGNKVLLVDMDGQYNLTTVTGADKDATGIYEVLTGTEEITDVIQELESGLFIIPASPLLAVGQFDVKRLQIVLEPLREKFDYIIIDAPPALGILSAACVAACDSVIIPSSASVLGAEGIRQFYEGLIESIRTGHDGQPAINGNLQIEGILINNYNGRTKMAKLGAELLESIAMDEMGTKVFASRVRTAAAVQEAEVYRQSIFEYAPKSKITEDYRKLIKEITGEN